MHLCQGSRPPVLPTKSTYSASNMAEEFKAPGQMSDGTHYVMGGPESSQEVVVFLHGTGYSYWHFNRMAAYLNGLGFRTVQYDLVGRGFSEPSANGKYGQDEHMRQLENLIDALNLPRPLHLVGHSFGGSVASVFTATHQPMVKSLTLLAAAGMMNSFPMSMIRSAPLMRRTLKNSQMPRKSRVTAWRADFHQHTGASLVLEEEMVQHLSTLYDHRPQVFEAYFHALMQFPMYGIGPHLDQIANNPAITVQLMWGKEDKALAYKPHFDRFAEHLSGKACKFTTKVFEGVGHGFLLEKHQEVNEAIGNFLTSCKA